MKTANTQRAKDERALAAWLKTKIAFIESTAQLMAMNGDSADIQDLVLICTKYLTEIQALISTDPTFMKGESQND